MAAVPCKIDEPRTVAFVGLGAMGWGMAATLASGAADSTSVASPVLVWNRTTSRAEAHAAEFGTACAPTLAAAAAADVIVSCLPTSAQVAAVAAELGPRLGRGGLWIDCTSGEPTATRAIAAKLAAAGVRMVDCPVSGGPAGAASGQLTAMMGGDADGVDAARPIVALFARKKVVFCGGLGAGHAVKAVNNALNAAHLAVAGEGLLALAKLGVAPAAALDAINGSSGMSRQTLERLPREVLPRRFAYGFKLGLMLKDVSIAVDGVGGGEGRLLPAVKRLLEDAVAGEGGDADYTRLLRTQERAAGVELHDDARAGEPYAAPPYVPGPPRKRPKTSGP